MSQDAAPAVGAGTGSVASVASASQPMRSAASAHALSDGREAGSNARKADAEHGQLRQVTLPEPRLAVQQQSPAASASPLSAGCAEAKSGHALTLKLCSPEPDAAWLAYVNVGTAVLALLVSCAAAYVAHRTLHFARAQDQRNRSASVRDEFWLRTVISPSSIEPFQAYMNELRATLPSVETNPPSAEDLKQFFAKTASSLNDFAIKFSALALISESLHEAIREELEGIEDAIANYVQAMTSYVPGGNAQAPSRAELQTTLTAGMVRLFKRIQEDQSRVD